MRISVFWGQERLADRSISKRYLKSDIATRVEKSSTSRAIHAHDTGYYWLSENVLHERLSLVVALESEWKRYSSSQSDKKNPNVRVWIQLKMRYNKQHWKTLTSHSTTISPGSGPDPRTPLGFTIGSLAGVGCDSDISLGFDVPTALVAVAWKLYVL